MKPRHVNPSGFTILELLVVLAIMAVVTGIGSVAFVKITGHWNGLRLRTEMDRSCENIFASIQQDLNSVIPASLTPVPLTGKADAVTMPEFFGIPLADDTLSIPVLAPNQEGRQTPVLATYSVTRDDSGAPLLVRGQRPVDAGEDAESAITLARGVLQFRVEYADGGKWVEGWTSSSLPAAIRVSLNLAVPGDPLREQVSRVQVFPVQVQ
ncbi:MAG: hypothetical protein AMXMBFR82_18740 [Candidatus Hydrogenedentota bacterium]